MANPFDIPFLRSGLNPWDGTIPWEKAAGAIADKAGRFSSTLSGAAADVSAKIIPLAPIIADSLSVVCNGSSYVSKNIVKISSSLTSTLFLQLTLLKSLIVIGLGLNIIRKNVGEIAKAYESQDLESGASYALHGGFGMNLTTVGFASLVAEIARLPAAATVLSASIAGLVASGAGLLMSSFLGIYASYELYHARQFISGVKGDTPDRTIDEMYTDFSELAVNEQKIKRSIGSEGVSALMTELGIEDESALLSAIQKVTNPEQKEEILNLVFEHNYRLQVKFVRLILISLVSACAFTAGLVFTGGLANLLFVFGAILWATLDAKAIDQGIGDRIWNWRKDSVLPTALKIENLQMESQFIVKVTDKDGKDSHAVQDRAF